MGAKGLKRVLAAIAVCVLSGAGAVSADIHLISVQTRSFAGTSRTRNSTEELWACPDKEYRNTGGRVMITRRDKGIIWSIDSGAGTYTERAIGNPAVSATPETSEKPHNQGYEYDPEYDWMIEDAGSQEVVSGVPCRKQVLDGDADLSERVIELWTAPDLGPALPRDARTLGYFLARTEAGPFLARWDAFKDRFVLRERVTEDPPIGPTWVQETKFTKFEAADPPAGIYNLPPGLKKQETRAER